MEKRGALIKKTIVSTEIYLLIISVFAFSFLISEVDRVIAQSLPIDTSNLRLKQGADKSKISSASTATGTNSVPHYLTGSSYEGSFAVDSVSGSRITVDVSKSVSFNQLENGNYEIFRGGDKIGVISKENFNQLQTSLPEGLTVNKAYDTSVLGVHFYGGWGHLVDGLVWAGIVVGAIQLIGPLFGTKPQLTNALSVSAIAGIFAYKGILAFTEQNFFGAPLKDTFVANYAPVIGIATAVVVFVLLYKKESRKIVELQCLPWEAPLGGADCERCNQDPLKPCSEYRCKSLGQACELQNKGTKEERCTWVSRNDVSSPVITPWNDILTNGYRYTDMQGRPPSRGTKIVKNDGSCVKPFTPLKFGIKTNEPSQCKIDTIGNKTFDSMQFFFGESNFFRYNHTEELRLPSPDSIKTEAPELPNEGTYNFYVRCRDANGNVNEDEFVFNLCVDKSPDTTPPIIESTSINSGSAVTFGIQQLNLSVFVNEPAECRWSIQDKTYDLMEQNMSCSTHVYQQNALQLYPCTTTLTGIKDRTDNNFFFRCKDQPSKPENERNVNSKSYKLILKGSEQLTITKAGPNMTFTGSTDVVSVDLTVETRNGAEEGKASCYFSPTGKDGSYIAMFETGGFTHKQTLALPSGSYSYFFRCVDNGGNADAQNTSFSVALDRQAPKVTRLYKEGPDALKLVTNEDAECAYSLNSCNFVFGEGIAMRLLSPSVKTVHIAEWKPDLAYYIKCRDFYNNQPAPSACSVIASASNVV